MCLRYRKENPLMVMSMYTLSYVLTLRKRMDDLESTMQHMDSGNHSSAKLNLPMGRSDPGNWIAIWVPPDTQKKLIRAEMHKIRIEMLLHVGPNDQVEQADVVE